MAEQHEIKTLKRADVAQMTGRDLLASVGIYDPELRTWRNDDLRTYHDERKTWTVYSTSGHGKRAGTTYVHLYTKGQARIVTPDGKDTGDRVEMVFHYRGKASDRVGTYREID